MAEFFTFAVDKRLAPFWLPFGFRPGRDGVTITDDGNFLARFGFLRLETPLANIDEAHVTRDYRWWTAAGARMSAVDKGLTFGTNRSAGVCVHFREPVPSPLRRRGHPALTVTVTDVDGLTARLQQKPEASLSRRSCSPQLSEHALAPVVVVPVDLPPVEVSPLRPAHHV